MKATRLTVAVIVGAFSLALLPGNAIGGSCWNFRSADSRMAKKINKSRSTHDKRKLSLDPHLSKVARNHTRSMAGAGSLFHSSNLGSKVTHWKSLGENVGYATSVKELHKLFMQSEGHRANILNGSYRFVGVAVIRKNGYTWTTVVFESKKNPGTTLKMPNC
jgi:uncharacterized protein YkwD